MTQNVYRVMDAEGLFLTTIVAGEAFVEAAHPGRYELVGPYEPTASSSFPTLTRKQLRNGLLSIGVTSADVEAHIGAIADPIEREAAMIDWQDTQTYERTYPLVDQIAAAMPLPPEQVDALWMWSAGQ